MNAWLPAIGIGATVLVTVAFVLVAAAKEFLAQEKAIAQQIARVEADLKWLDSTGGAVIGDAPNPPKLEQPS